MANVRQLLSTRLLQDILDLRRKIVLTEFGETEIEEGGWVRVWIHMHASTGVFVASVVTKPNIVACTCQNVGSGLAFIVGDPHISRRIKSMLEENNGSIRYALRSHSEKS